MSDTKSKSFTKKEREALASAAKTGVIPEILRFAASRLNPIIAASSGAGGVVGTAGAGAAGALSRSALENYYINNLDKVARQVAGQSARPGALSRIGSTVNTPLRAGVLGSSAMQLNQLNERNQ